MDNNSISDEIRKVLEHEDCPDYVKLLAISQLETRKDVCMLKKELEYLRMLNKWQIGLLVSMLISIVVALIGVISSHYL